MFEGGILYHKLLIGVLAFSDASCQNLINLKNNINYYIESLIKFIYSYFKTFIDLLLAAFVILKSGKANAPMVTKRLTFDGKSAAIRYAEVPPLLQPIRENLSKPSFSMSLTARCPSV